jgi:MFS family permease
LGIAEGVYWPQQSRFAKGWFAANELTRANSLIQYYGQYLALAVGFMVLTPVFNAFGWRVTFYITGGLVLVIVPLYALLLKPESQAPHKPDVQVRRPLTWKAVGGYPFCLLVFSYITQGMLFWGITLWIPLVVKSLGFTGMGQAVASALPYAVAVLLAIPMSIISDKTNKRILIAGLGLLIPGIMLLLLPQVDSPTAKLALITVALGYYASSYTPNIWSILQSNVEPEAVGAASGIINGLGAGGGGTLAGFLVGLLRGATGSYIPGFMALGGLVVLGSVALFIYGRLTSARAPVSPLVRPAG